MNRRAIAVVLLSILAALPSAFATSPAPSDVAGASAVAPAQVVPKAPAAPKRDAAMNGDARRCLEFQSNLQVIMCAEKYRSHRRAVGQ